MRQRYLVQKRRRCPLLHLLLWYGSVLSMWSNHQTTTYHLCCLMWMDLVLVVRRRRPEWVAFWSILRFVATYYVTMHLRSNRALRGKGTCARTEITTPGAGPKQGFFIRQIFFAGLSYTSTQPNIAVQVECVGTGIQRHFPPSMHFRMNYVH